MGSIKEFFKQNEKNKPHETVINFTLPPESDTGNIEYKLKIVNPTKNRFEHLVTQMKWRLREGNGEAFYEIGVDDSGALTGISKSDMEKSIENIIRMATVLEASAKIIYEKELEDGGMLTEVLISKLCKNKDNRPSIRVAVIGGPYAGKSTLLGVLTQGHLDNSRGKARINMFNHLHELKSGLTSSISHEFIGFDAQGKLVNYNSRNFITAEDISVESSKLVTFLDLPGHEKYLKTTIQGLCGYFPNYVMLVISSTSGIVNMTHEHLLIAIALKLKIFVVVTKTDITSPCKSIRSFTNLIRCFGKSEPIVIIINNMIDALKAGSNLTHTIIPVFCLSNVNGNGLELLTKFLYALPAERTLQLENKDCVFQINSVFPVAHVGNIVAGFLKEGVIHLGDKLLIGPISGSFKTVFVESIHQYKVPRQVITPGQTAAIKLKNNSTLGNLRHGMILLKFVQPPACCLAFEAVITFLPKIIKITLGCRCTVYIGSIRQRATIQKSLKINGQIQYFNRKWLVGIRFVKDAEYVQEGNIVFLKQGLLIGVGKVVKVFSLNATNRKTIL